MRVNVNLKQHDICMGLDIPDIDFMQIKDGDVKNGQLQVDLVKCLSRVLVRHVDFKANIQPDVPHEVAFHKQCAAEVNAIHLFFPHLWSESILTVFAAWLGFACVMDDTLETFSPQVIREVLYECMDIMRPGAQKSEVKAVDMRIQRMTATLRSHCSKLLTLQCAHAFFEAVCDVFEAHVDESRFLRGLIPCDISTYMSIRCRTISLNPFFEVIKTQYLPHNTLLHPIWHELQHAVSFAAGLQNDLIGLERDIEKGEELNAVIVLLQNNHMEQKERHDNGFEDRLNAVVEEHNHSVARAKHFASAADQLGQGTEAHAVASVVKHILLLARTHLMWCTTAKRYQTEINGEGQKS